jgi:Ca-activated chloride channel homolog
MTPRIARGIVVAVAAVAVLTAAFEPFDAQTNAGGTTREIRLSFVYTPDAEDLLAPLIEQVNSEHHRLGGREVRVDGTAVTSGEAEAALATRRLQPVLWTPASSLWGRLLNYDGSTDWVPAENPSLVASPQVIAMWRPLARALGWPDSKIGWNEILALARSRRGWAEYGHPEYGPFRLGHTNPDFSTSGLFAIASEYYAVTGKRTDLTLADVHRPAVRAAVSAIERSIVHYGETAAALTDQMDRYGEAYVHAVYIQETTLREFNKDRRQATPLVGVRPADGTFVADYPLIVLDAPWVSPDSREAGDFFGRWLRQRITPEMASKSGFRLSPPSGMARLELPQPDVLSAIRTAWHEDRKPANIVLVVDTSSSMGGAGRLDAAKVGLQSFLRELSDRDRVALLTSGESVDTKVALGPPPRSRPAVANAVGKLFPNGELPVYGAVSQALDDIHTLSDPSRINAVVVLSDGAGTTAGLDGLLGKIRESPVTEGSNVRVFTVAYGGNADAGALQRIAEASGGAFFAGGPKDIKDVYRSLSSYF